MKDFAEKSRDNISDLLSGLVQSFVLCVRCLNRSFGVENAMHREFKGFHYNFCVNFSCEQFLRHEVSRK